MASDSIACDFGKTNPTRRPRDRHEDFAKQSHRGRPGSKKASRPNELLLENVGKSMPRNEARSPAGAASLVRRPNAPGGPTARPAYRTRKANEGRRMRSCGGWLPCSATYLPWSGAREEYVTYGNHRRM
jgi:hypothetical protein